MPRPSSMGEHIGKQRRLVITCALLTSTFLGSLDVTVVGTAMPSIVSTLGGLELYGWVFAIYLLTSTVSVPIYAKLADRIGRRPVWIFGVVLFLGGSAACAMSPSMEVLIAARAIQGVGGGALTPMTMTIAGDLYAVEERARLQGIIALVWGASSAAGPLVGALILEVTTWPWIYWLNFPVGLLALLVFVLSYRERVENTDAPIDVAGAARVSVALFALLLSMQLLGTQPLAAAGLFALSVVVGAWFVARARKTADPVLPLSLFRDRPIRAAAMASVVLGGVLFSVIAFMPLLVRGAWGRAATAVGAGLIPLSLGWSVGSYAAGRMAMTLGFRAPMRIGGVLLAIGNLGVFFIVERSSLIGLAVCSAIIGVGFGLSMSTMNVLTQDRVPWNTRGAATGLLLFSRTVGGSIVVAAMGLLLNAILVHELPNLDPEIRAQAGDPEALTLLPDAVRLQAEAAIKHAVHLLMGGAAGLAGLAGILLLLSPASKPGERATTD